MGGLGASSTWKIDIKFEPQWHQEVQTLHHFGRKQNVCISAFGVYVHICKFILPGQERPRQDIEVDRPSVEVEGWTSYEPIVILSCRI